MNYHPKIAGKRLPSTAVCERYGINRRTLGRWMLDPDMGFPTPATLNSRHYFSEAELDDFDRRAVLKLGKAA